VSAYLTDHEQRIQHDEEKGDIKPTAR